MLNNKSNRKADITIFIITILTISVYLYYYYSTMLLYKTVMEAQLVFTNLYNVLQLVEYSESTMHPFDTFLLLWEERLQQLNLSKDKYMNLHLIKNYLHLMIEFLKANDNCDKNLLDLCNKFIVTIGCYHLLLNIALFILSAIGSGCFIYILNFLYHLF